MKDGIIDVPKITYDNEAIVVSRPNRFLMIADVIMEDGTILKNEKVHVHDPGRLKEVIFPGNRVRIRKAMSRKRKTLWDLIFGLVSDTWVLVNSSFHRYIAQSILSDRSLTPFADVSNVRPEVKVGHSRLDFMLTMKDGSTCFIEVKGCTLSVGGRSLFPDAPTERGTRHLEELIRLKEEGHGSAVLFLVLAPDPVNFSPNRETDPVFADTLKKAVEMGVKVYPLDIDIEDGVPVLNGVLPLIL